MLELQQNKIEEIKGLENLDQLNHLNLWENPVYEGATKKFGGTKMMTGEFKKPQLLVKFCQEQVDLKSSEETKVPSRDQANRATYIPTKLEAQDYVQQKINEKLMLEKFKSILEMAQEVNRDDVALSLGLSKMELFEKLLQWKKNLPFVIKGDLIIVHDINDFIGKMDQQFDSWGKNGENSNKRGKPNGKLHKRDILQEEIHECKQLLEDEQKIRMVFVIHKESGGMLINQFYGLEDLDDKSDLITGFLTTVSQWGKEVHSSSKDDGLSLLSWKNFHIHLERGDHIMLAIVCDDPLNSKEIQERIKNLITLIESKYQKELKRFTGNIKPFEEIVPIIDKSLRAVHQFPCKIDLTKLKEAPISTGIKQFFTTQSYKKDKFYIMDVIQDLKKENNGSRERDVYKDIYTLLDNQIISHVEEKI